MATATRSAVTLSDGERDGSVSAPGGARRGWRIMLVLVGSVVLIGLVAATVAVAGDRLSERSRDQHREAIVAAATEGVLALIDVHTDTADADLQRLRDLSTGDFAAELSDSGSGLASAIRDSAVDSTGRIDAAALVSESGESGVVIVAASAQVVNSGSPDATPRTYRLRVTVDDVDGELMMSKVEFVP